MAKPSLDYIKGGWAYLRRHPAFREAPARTLSRAAWWYIHCLLRIPATIEVPLTGGVMFLPPRLHHSGATGVFVLREHYEPELRYLAHTISQGMVVVDGGASFGIYTLMAARMVGPLGRVLAFEPAAESFSILSHNLRLNKLTNVRAFQAGLSDRSGEAPLYHTAGAPNRYSLAYSTGSSPGFEPVQTVTLDNALRSEGVDRLDLLKLDVEGAEELALRGAEGLLRGSSPIVIFEMSPTVPLREGLARDGAWRLLQTLDYSLFALDEHGYLMPLTEPRFGNNIAIPRQADRTT
jgi:FkbM family methyltransferase